MEQVALAFEGGKTSAHIRDILENAGVADCLICHSAAEIKRLVYQQGITTVICGYKFRDETAESLFEDLSPNCSVLVIAMQNMLDLIGSGEIFKLAAPVSHSDLLSTVQMLLQMGPPAEKFVKPRRPAKDQAFIEAAKKVLMDRHGMTEQQAHSFLQKRSMDSGVKLVQTAQMILNGVWYN